jgi:ubiquitin-conjugating enzyme E2 Z
MYMTTFISKETMNRLLKDVKQIIKNPLTEQGIYYVHDDTDMLKGYSMIVGPSETPYFGGFYFFEFTYPNDYPHSPPKVKYCTNGNDIRFNPNLYKCGKVCVSLLNTWRGDQWTSCQSISTVLLTLCTLLCKDPLLNEPGVLKGHRDINNYNEIIEYSNISIAVCDIVRKKKGVYLPFFENFYPYVKENFNKNYDKLLEFAKKKMTDNNVQNKTLVTGFYNMNVQIYYDDVILKLNEAKEMSAVL